MKRPVLSVALALLSSSMAACPGCAREGPDACDWSQFGHDFTHAGSTCAPGQPFTRKLAQFPFDPFVPQAVADSHALLAHYQTPIVSDDALFMLVKTGSYGGPKSWNSQIWNEACSTWKNGVLSEVWRFESDWKPEPAELATWEPVFQPALWRDVLYVPGAGGTVFKVDRFTGRQLARVNPFGDAVDPNTFVAGGLAADSDGSVYYNAIKLDPQNPFSDVLGAWLVKVAPDGKSQLVAFRALTPAAPAPDALCKSSFPRGTPKPLPPPPDANGNPAQPPSFPCLSQRPGFNVTPGIGLDGTVYTVSRAHGNAQYGYLVAVRPDLTLKWAASLRGVLSDGCGVLIPADGKTGNCRQGATPGVDPSTNDMPVGVISDQATSSPVALPDGTVLFGAVTGYNYARGHLFHFAANGSPLGTFDFGWDVTPAVYRHDGTFSIVVKDNHYFGAGQDEGPYQLTRLAADLKPEWSFTSTNTQTCTPAADGGLDCQADHPDGFEWCVNAPAVDPEGTVYANSEDGYLYAIDKTGALKERIFLNEALGAAYTPVALDARGRIYALNGGILTVVGK